MCRHNDLSASIYVPRSALITQDGASAKALPHPAPCTHAASVSATTATSAKTATPASSTATATTTAPCSDVEGPLWTDAQARAPVALALPSGLAPAVSTHGATLPLHPLVSASWSKQLVLPCPTPLARRILTICPWLVKSLHCFCQRTLRMLVAGSKVDTGADKWPSGVCMSIGGLIDLVLWIDLLLIAAFAPVAACTDANQKKPVTDHLLQHILPVLCPHRPVSECQGLAPFTCQPA